jgi:signal transduction histidine kinase
LLESADRESRRIGEQLHDHLCQVLLGAGFAAKSVAMSLPPSSPAVAELDELVRLINSAAEQTRDIARALNPSGIDAAGLANALERLISRPYAGFDCRFECTSAIRLPDARAARHFYRIAEEAITNAVRHSRGTEIVVRLTADDQGVHLQIADNGRGFEADLDARGGLGLAMMKYRAEAIQASLRFDTRDEGGANITFSLPKRK